MNNVSFTKNQRVKKSATVLSLTLLIFVTASAHALDINASVQKQFAPLVDQALVKSKKYHGIVVGVVTPTESKIISLGQLSDKADVPTEKTIFEVGSVTKGVVGLSLAQAVIDGKISLDTPFSDSVALSLPQFKNDKISWRNLAQHTSGLPRVPSNLNSTNPLQPYVKYSVSDLQQNLETFCLAQKPGTMSEYSNLGAGLVGYGLESVRNKPVEQILREDFVDRLSMNDTRIFLSPEQTTRLAPVFLNGEPVEAWAWNADSVLKSAGALRSTASDMIPLLGTLMGIRNQSVLPAIELATRPTFKISTSSELGLFWNYSTQNNIIWHNGATYGSSSFIGYDPDRLIGVVVLSNSNFIDEKSGQIDSRLDLAAVKLIRELVAANPMTKPIAALKAYDAEVEKRNAAFDSVPANPADRAWVTQKFTHMFDVDQFMRRQTMDIDPSFTAEEKDFYQLGFSRRFYMMDWRNTQDLKKLLKQYGWFKISDWGKVVDNQAWILVQHADHDPDFQREILKVLETLYPKGETSASNYAYLFDRVAASWSDETKRRPQRYGTQGMCTGPGTWEPLPIENPADVDKRRAEVGLGTLQSYKDGFKSLCK